LSPQEIITNSRELAHQNPFKKPIKALEEWYYSNFESKKYINDSLDTNIANNILNLYKNDQLTTIGSILSYLTNILKDTPRH
ncbi:hypothetical protein, partial [Francisella tularensis]|uniref:hypothetical protein n=1 Tax=Francisella tularensis TaxID=263 RepID=UPI002381AF4F